MAAASQKKEIVFIHGLFMNSNSWEQWVNRFQNKDYICHAPSYPYHDGEPAALREKVNPGLATLAFHDVIDHLAAHISTLSTKPILVGHSVGGLAVQTLISMGKGSAGVCIDTAPPKGIISFRWSFLKANLSTVNPMKGNSICLPSVKWFHYAFCNTMTIEDTERAFNRYVVPESRNIPRSTNGPDGYIDFSKHHAPLLFISGEKDHIIPSSLNLKNFRAYTDPASRRDFYQFPGRTHFICAQDGWEEVASYVEQWVSGL
jgi:pimeloyl-ACP methyl ester carboxylesterase